MEAQLNPLLIPHILDIVCKNEGLSKSDLLNMREVCQLWNSRVTRVYEKLLELKLGGVNDPGAHTTRMYEGLALLQHPKSTLPLPSTVHFDYHLFEHQGKAMPMFQRAFVKFLEFISEGIQTLRLHHNLSKGDYHIVNYQRAYLLDTVGDYFPRLTKMTITCLNDNLRLNGFFTSLAVHVLKNARILTQFNLLCEDREVVPVGEALEEMIIPNIPRTVQKLGIAILLTPYGATAIGSLKFQNLLSLKLGLLHADLTAEGFYRMLQKFSENLISLSIRECSCPVKFPVFPSLKSVKIWFDENRSEDAQEEDDLEPFTALFPVATTFNGLYHQDALDTFFPTGFSAPGVLNCTFPLGINDYGSMMKLVQGFSSVRRLTLMPADSEGCSLLTLVFQWMELLEDLRICFRGTWDEEEGNGDWVCLDSVLTGIKKDMCRRIKKTKRVDWENIELQSVKTSPGLTDLRHLKLLRIQVSDDSKFYLTDITGCLGYFKLESSVCIQTYMFALSERCRKSLRSRFASRFMVEKTFYVSPDVGFVDFESGRYLEDPHFIEVWEYNFREGQTYFGSVNGAEDTEEQKTKAADEMLYKYIPMIEEQRCVSEREVESEQSLNEDQDQAQNGDDGDLEDLNVKSDDEDDGIVWLGDELVSGLPNCDASMDFLWKIEGWEFEDDPSLNDQSEAIEFQKWSDVTPLPSYGVVILGCM